MNRCQSVLFVLKLLEVCTFTIFKKNTDFYKTKNRSCYLVEKYKININQNKI